LATTRRTYTRQIFADRDFLVWLGLGGDFIDVRENVVFRVVVDDLDAALFEMFQRSELRLMDRTQPARKNKWLRNAKFAHADFERISRT
jgi:hypothetical protein